MLSLLENEHILSFIRWLLFEPSSYLAELPHYYHHTLVIQPLIELTFFEILIDMIGMSKVKHDQSIFKFVYEKER